MIRLEPRLGAQLKGLFKTVCSVSDPAISEVNEKNYCVSGSISRTQSRDKHF